MVTIVTRSGKGSALTNTEIDTNFTNLNTGKVEDVTARATYLPSLLLDFANGKSLDPRVSFSRASTATYYDGVTTAMAEQNLLTWSQDFDNAAWMKGSTTVSANQTTAPDGTTTADLLYPASTGIGRYIWPAASVATVSAVTVVTSWYVKASSWTWVMLNGEGSANGVWFNIATGAKGTEKAGYTGTISDAGNNWWRITVTQTRTGTLQPTLWLCDADNTLACTASGTNGVFIWGAQLEQRSSVTAYTATNAPIASGTELVTNGDFSSGTSWTLGAGWSISSGALNGATGAFSVTSQTGAYVAGRTYRVQLDVTCSAGYVNVYINSGTGYIAQTTAKHVFYLVAGSSGTLLSLGGASFTGTIDNISVQEITSYTAGPITNYVPQLLTAPANTPRFQHDPVTGESLGLLIEEQRTNLLTNSESFEGSGWGLVNATVTANSTVAPDGTTTADTFTPDTTNTQHYVNQNIGAVAVGQTYTLSVYAKSNGYNWISLQPLGGQNVWFDLANGVVGTVGSGNTASIQSVGSGWYRCNVTIVSAVTVSSYIFIRPSNNGFSFAGNGTSGVFLWGAQLEAGSFATSYIPTVASQVTRNADSASMTGTNFSSWYNPSEGTLALSGSYALQNGVTNFNVGIAGNASISSVSRDFRFLVNGTNVGFNNAGATDAVYSFSVAGTYKTGDFATTLNGAAVTTSTSAVIAPGTSFAITPNKNSGTIRRFAYYPERLPNADLQSLTA